MTLQCNSKTLRDRKTNIGSLRRIKGHSKANMHILWINLNQYIYFPNAWKHLCMKFSIHSAVGCLCVCVCVLLCACVLVINHSRKHCLCKCSRHNHQSIAPKERGKQLMSLTGRQFPLYCDSFLYREHDAIYGHTEISVKGRS